MKNIPNILILAKQLQKVSKEVIIIYKFVFSRPIKNYALSMPLNAKHTSFMQSFKCNFHKIIINGCHAPYKYIYAYRYNLLACILDFLQHRIIANKVKTK